MLTPTNTRYYVLDGLGHVRLLLDPAGMPTDLYHYDSWGNPIPTGTETTRQPFRWNGAYRYTYQPFTGLYHLNPDYDPKTKRYLQRQGSNPTNPYLHADNDPVDDLDIDENTNLLNSVRRDPSGRGRRGAQQLKTVAHTVAESHPLVLGTEAAYGRDCVGEELSGWERLGKGIAAVAGLIGSGIGRTVQTVGRWIRHAGQSAGRVVVQGYARVRRYVYRVVAQQGQKHHVLSNPVMREINRHPTLAGKFNREQWKVQAAAPCDHKGYQEWHREIDKEIIQWLQNHQNATPEEFIAKLREIYSRPEMVVRFPDALDIIK